MQTYIAILRGINVGGKRIIKMEDLIKCIENIGFSDVSTYIQSGNVIFNSQKAAATDKLEKKLQQSIFDVFSFEVPVIIRTLAEMQEIKMNNPFLDENNIDSLYLTFLKRNPSSDKTESLLQSNFQPDQYLISCKNIFIKCQGRYSETKLSNQFFESKLKVSATTRNWKTFCKLVEIAEEKQK